MSQHGYARSAGSPDDYRRLGIKPGSVAIQEDGQREATGPGVKTLRNASRSREPS